jgi:hypothetical protein
MILDWLKLASAAGFDPSRLSVDELHILYGKIIRDSDLRKLCLAQMQGSVISAGARADVLQKMTPQERAEFRKRIS